MTHEHHDALWRDFPKTAQEFDARFHSEEACKEFLALCRWNGKPTCAKCGHEKVYALKGRSTFECAECRHHTSLTSGTLFHGTRKPLKDWFRAIFEVCVHGNGISAANLGRILGFGSKETPWVWLHKIRRAMVSENRDKLMGCVQLDETLIGGVGSEKEIVVVSAEEFRRVRLTHAPGNHEDALKVVVDQEIGEKTPTKTDGNPAYNKKSLGDRPHDPKVQSKAERKTGDHLQLMHWMASNLKKWLQGTHFDAVTPKHLQSYLDEYAFRYNRRKTNGIARLVARSLENMVMQKPLTMRQLVDNTHECRNFQCSSY